MTAERTGNGWTAEEIAALVDGSLEEPRAAEIRAILETDAEAQQIAQEIEASNVLLRDAFADLAEAPIPARLEAAVLGAPEKVVAFPRARKTSILAGGWLSHAVAAALFLAIGLAGGRYLTDGPGGTVTAGKLPGDAPLLVALETLPSGTALGDTYVPMLSFQDGAGRYCREFEIRGTSPDQIQHGLACRGADTPAWRVELVVAGPEAGPETAGYSLASGPGGDAFEAMLDALGAGPVLPPETEAALIDGGWTAPR